LFFPYVLGKGGLESELHFLITKGPFLSDPFIPIPGGRGTRVSNAAMRPTAEEVSNLDEAFSSAKKTITSLTFNFSKC
jgi:hypothetical protein